MNLLLAMYFILTPNDDTNNNLYFLIYICKLHNWITITCYLLLFLNII